MADQTTYVKLRRETLSETYNVQLTLNDNWTKIDALFDPTTPPTLTSPRAMLRETAITTTYTTSGSILNFTPTWNGAGAVLRGIYMDITHSAAAAGSRPLDIRRGGNAIFDVDITSQVAVNGLSLRGGATANPAALVAIGPDTNISISLVPKGTGSVILGGAVTLTDFTNANHTHANAANGGTIAHTALTAIGTNTHAQIDTALTASASHIAATGASVHGLGTMSTQGSGAVSISGGTISGVTLTVPGATVTDDINLTAGKLLDLSGGLETYTIRKHASLAEMDFISEGDYIFQMSAVERLRVTGTGLRFANNGAPASPANGDMWYDGTSMKVRIGGVTRTFTVT